MLTFEQLKALPAGQIFAQGTLPNNPQGIFMTDENEGHDLTWLAKRGHGPHDWAIYCYWAGKQSNEWILKHGQKVTAVENIQKCVPCTPQVLAKYRK